MKSVLFVALLFAGAGASAQSPVISVDTTGDRLLRLYNMVQQRSLLPQAKFSHNTPKGAIYTLPIDNRPCRVPNMPGMERMRRQIMPQGQMPNVIPPQQIIPDQEKKEDKKD